MIDLNSATCQACQAGAPLVTQEQIDQLLPQIPEWQIVRIDEVDRLRRVFRFKNFAEALAFTNKVGQLAELAGHHPAILTEWGKVTISWWSHKIRGLHVNDFILAAQTDKLT
jgi:4a-hydroxytetrahydrobiopterin dehydratase